MFDSATCPRIKETGEYEMEEEDKDVVDGEGDDVGDAPTEGLGAG